METEASILASMQFVCALRCSVAHPPTDLSSQTMPPYLPGEITDVVIANVWPDSPSLRSCALVHRQWLPASRYYLFLAIQIDNASTYTLLVERVLRSGELRVWLEHTRELRILNAEDPDAVADFPAPFGKRFLYEFAGHLPRLESLELFHIDFFAGGFHPGAYLAFSRFVSVEALSFTNCVFPSFATFRRLLVELPSLQDLSLSNVRWHSALEHCNYPLGGTPQRPLRLLNSLFISDTDEECARVLFRWLDLTSSSKALRRLSFEAGMASDPKSFEPIGASLTDVHIWLYDDVGKLRTSPLVPPRANARVQPASVRCCLISRRYDLFALLCPRCRRKRCGCNCSRC